MRSCSLSSTQMNASPPTRTVTWTKGGGSGGGVKGDVGVGWWVVLWGRVRWGPIATGGHGLAICAREYVYGCEHGHGRPLEEVIEEGALREYVYGCEHGHGHPLEEVIEEGAVLGRAHTACPRVAELE